MGRLLDFYYRFPLAVDAFLTTVILYGSFHPIFELKLNDKSVQLNLLNSLSSCSVSLAGFMLAALTIIVTFRSNIKAKGLDEAGNAMEMILASKHYHSVVSVFRKAITEYTLTFIILMVLWSMIDQWDIWVLFRINICSILAISLSTIRSLFILFQIIKMETSN